MRKTLLFLLSCWLALPLMAQSRDSLICAKCVPVKVDTTHILVSVDTVPIQVRIDSTYAAKIDTTFRDSIITIPGPPTNQPSVTAVVGVNTCTTRTDGGWVVYQGTDPRLTVVDDSQRGSVCRANFANQASGSGPVHLSRSVPLRPGTLYLSTWFKVSPSWVNHPSNVVKIFHFWIAGVNRVFFALDGQPNGVLRFGGHLQQVVGGSRNLPANGNGVIQRGQWAFLEVTMTANGSFRWWVNGKLAGDYTTVFLSPSQSHAWEKAQWAPTFGGMCATPCPAPAMDMYMDDLTVASGP